MNGIKELRVTLTDYLHKKFREACEKEKKPMIQVIMSMIKEFTDKKENENDR